MKINEIVDRCIKEPTLVDALSLAAVIETDRVVRSYKGTEYETCFKTIFNLVKKAWDEVKQ